MIHNYSIKNSIVTMDIVPKHIYTKYQNTIVVNVQNRDDLILISSSFKT